MKTDKVVVQLPIKGPDGKDIEVILTVKTVDGVVQQMTCVQTKSWEEISLSN